MLSNCQFFQIKAGENKSDLHFDFSYVAIIGVAQTMSFLSVGEYSLDCLLAFIFTQGASILLDSLWYTSKVDSAGKDNSRNIRRKHIRIF